MSSNVPIQSTAGAIPLKNEKGQVYMQKVKVNRYVTGKRPDYAADSSSEESEDEFELQRQKKAPKEEPVEVQDNEPEIKDRRLRRLQERDISQDSDDEDRVTRHRREVIEPELIQEGSDSETEARGRREEEDSDAENEDLDEEEIERRRALLRQRALQRQEEEEILDVEDEKDDAESESETSGFEEYTDSEEETGPRLRPVFVRKKDRITIQEKEREELKQKQLEIEAKKLAEERRKNTLKMVADEARREIEEERSMAEACNQVESEEENDEEEYEAWKVRELRRLKRDKEERENIEKEKAEIEKMRNMTEDDRRQDLKQNPKTVTNKAPKGKYKFLQKYYHRGAFFLDQDDDRLQQDFSSPTLEDHFNKTVLPKVMQVKNFGRSGRTKYTHLVDQDTTQFDAPWMTDTSQNLKFHTAKGGGMKQGYERPSGKKRK